MQRRGEEGINCSISSVLLNPGEDVRRLETILDTLQDDEWMENVRVWRKYSIS